MKCKTYFVAIFFLILNYGYLQSANLALADSPEDFVRSLYKEHLAQYDKGYWFDNEKKLSEYFDHNLTILFLRDEECKEKTHGICNLDFDPIIAAQDFDKKYTVSLEVEKLNSKSPIRCKVVFSNISQRTLIYELQETKRGWRISDIIYSNGQSLKKLLSQKLNGQ